MATKREKAIDKQDERFAKQRHSRSKHKNRKTDTAKYEERITRSKSVEPILTAVAHPYELHGTRKAMLLMKGILHLHELIAAVVSREGGLPTGCPLSHVFHMSVPTYHENLIVTNTAINIAPTLEYKVDIIQNVIELVSAGQMLGANILIILISKADSVRSRITSCSVAMRAAHTTA